MSIFRLTPRTQAQREHIIEERLRLKETGEFMEKLGLAASVGMAPWDAMKRGESERDLRARAARAGLLLPGATPPVLEEQVRLRKLERETGLQVAAMPAKDRWSSRVGLRGASAWDVPDLADFDMSQLNQSAAGTVIGVQLALMPNTNAGLIGSPDPLGPSLAAATVSRAIGSGTNPFATLLDCWVVARTAAGGAYAPANATLALLVISAFTGATNISTTLAGPLTLSTITGIWTQQALTAPADRGVPNLSGALLAGVVALFYGDILKASLVTTVALNVQGNTLSQVLEVI